MSASTIPLASPSCRSWPISAKRVPSPSWRPPLPYYAKLAIRIERVMTDNGSCYRYDFPSSLQAPWPSLHSTNQREGRALHPNRT
jgi:hypothetical protein